MKIEGSFKGLANDLFQAEQLTECTDDHAQELIAVAVVIWQRLDSIFQTWDSSDQFRFHIVEPMERDHWGEFRTQMLFLRDLYKQIPMPNVEIRRHMNAIGKTIRGIVDVCEQITPPLPGVEDILANVVSFELVEVEEEESQA